MIYSLLLGQILVDCQNNTFLKRCLRIPAEIILDPGRVNAIPVIMS